METTASNERYPPPPPNEPPLHRASRVGDHDAIRAEIASGAAIEQVFDIEQDEGACACPATALMVAAGSGDGASVETVRLLLELGADPRNCTTRGSAACFAVCGLGWGYRPGGDVDRLKLLVAAGAPLPSEGEDAARLVADAARIGDPQRLRVLLANDMPANAHFDQEVSRKNAAQYDAILKQCDEYESNELLECIKDEYDELIKQSSLQAASGPYGFSIPLFMAAESGSGACVDLLIEAGADLAQLDNSGQNALFSARSPEAVNSLARAGISLDVEAEFERDALRELLDEMDDDPEENKQIAATCRAMIHAGVPLVHANRDRNRLYDAAFAENLAAVEFLLSEGHPIDPDEDGRTALHAICWHWDYEDEKRDERTRNIVRTLIATGIDPIKGDCNGVTPLHEAMAGDGANLIAAEELIVAGADVNAQDDWGNTPLTRHYSSLFEYDEIVPFLLKHGADPRIRNRHGENAIDMARRMIRGEDPQWREEQFADDGGPPCGWKAPADPDDKEHQMLALLQAAALKFASDERSSSTEI